MNGAARRPRSCAVRWIVFLLHQNDFSFFFIVYSLFNDNVQSVGGYSPAVHPACVSVFVSRIV